MARLLGILVILVLIISAIGLYRGWFTAHSSSGPDHTVVNVTVDKNAIRKDAETAKEEAQEAGARIKEDVSPTTRPAPNP